MADLWCHEPACSMPAQAYDEPFSMEGAGPGGRIRVWFTKVRCFAGHLYQLEMYEESL